MKTNLKKIKVKVKGEYIDVDKPCVLADGRTVYLKEDGTLGVYDYSQHVNSTHNQFRKQVENIIQRSIRTSTDYDRYFAGLVENTDYEEVK